MLNRRDAIGSLLMALGAESAASGQSTDQHWPNQVFTAAAGTTTHESFGDVTVYHEAKTNYLRNMIAGSAVLNPGQEPHPPHQHPEEEFMLIIEGAGEILVNGKSTPVSPGALMYCEGNAVHGIKNTGSVPMHFFYFKWTA